MTPFLGKGCFFFFTWVKKWVLLCFVSGIVPKVFKMLVIFPVWGVLVGCFFFGVLVFLCLFFFCVGFVFVLFALFLFSCWIVFGVGSCFVFVFFVGGGGLFLFVLVFFGGFKGQVRWPKGPPHLALNPPFFVFFCFLFFCFLFCF